ncbi:MAG: hypothetical protein NZ602_11730 [Thermoguttaceae bacterium]|nr:hypothetical protein [Thermoguttaceae bacterium]MDW8038324.1 hypothetical protein [Thermoguttaceae bacterium]
MKTVCFVLSMLALGVLLGLPLLEVLGFVGPSATQWGITGGTVCWFATAPFWMRYHS